MKVIEIRDGKVYEVMDEPVSGDVFVNTLIDAVELVQKAERLCQDALLRFHIHRSLLDLTTAISHAATRTAPRRYEWDLGELS